MVRYTIFLAIVLGSAATALAAISPGREPIPSHNVTVIEKNQAFPLIGPLIVAPCQTEDCSEV